MKSPRKRQRRLPRRPMIRKWTNSSSCNCRSRRRIARSMTVRFSAPRLQTQTSLSRSRTWKAASNPLSAIPNSQMVMMTSHPPMRRPAVLSTKKASRTPTKPSSISARPSPSEPLKANSKSTKRKRSKMPKKSESKTPHKLRKRRKSAKNKRRKRRKSRPSKTS